ncbi:UNVERIFIED_ORG: 8-oxo-dGTP pyrophosphatase MutT (NUDIX family) [Anoxybacillus amylolyticus]
MSKVIIQNIKSKITAFYHGETIELNERDKREINEYWEKLINDGRPLIRGPVFTILDISNSHNELNINLSLTDYAHYMYTINNPGRLTRECMVVFTSALVETVDGYLVIGEMGSHTSTPGRLQCPGGGIDKSDIKGRIVDFEGNIVSELAEELGIEQGIDYHKVIPKYIKTGGDNNFVAIIFYVNISLTKDELQRRFEILQSSKQSEFQSLQFIEKKKCADFSKINKKPVVDYLYPLLYKVQEDASREG